MGLSQQVSPHPQSGPAMLERDPFLAQLHALAREAAAGHGRLVFVGGEMGIGKTTLVERFRQEIANANAFTILSCDGFRINGPLGPLMDVARSLGPEVVALLEAQAPRDQIFRAVEAAMAAAPGLTVLVGEDVHWGDEASLDLLHFLGRRIGAMRTLFIATYRDDELPARHPLRRVLGDLATSSAVYRMTLPQLSLEAVTQLATGTPLDPVELHAYTQGNPFLVRQIVESGTNHPVTIQDVTAARADRLAAASRALLEAAACIGMTIDPDLLQAVLGGAIADGVDDCLAVGLFRTVDNAVQFRHAAVREAVVHTLSPIRRLVLHRRIYSCLQADPRHEHDHAFLAYHAEESASGKDAFRHAVVAAEDAARYQAHREGAAQFGRALRHCPPDPVEQRVGLLERCAYEHYLTGSLDIATAHQKEAIRLRRAISDPIPLGDSVRVLSRYTWFAGDTASATALANEALAILEPFPESREFALACSNMSQLCMLAFDHPGTIAWGERAMDLARALGDTATLVHAMSNVGATRMDLGQPDGQDLLHQARQLAEAEHLEDDVSRALTILAWSSWTIWNREAAQRYLDDGLAWSEAHDLVAMNLYMRAMRTQILLADGAWDESGKVAQAIVQHPLAIAVTRIVALVPLALSRVRRGEPAGDTLDLALELATSAQDLQRLGPVRAARAEAAWLADDPDTAAVESSAVLDLARERQHPWIAGELAMWVWRSGHGWPDLEDGELAEPYRLLKAGDWRAAAAFWQERGFPLEAARALASSTDESDLRAALTLCGTIGARPDAIRIANRLRELGYRHIQPVPPPATRDALLSPREVEVLRLIRDGRTDREIGATLFISHRTVNKHVANILAKLDVPTRSAAAARAKDAGLLPD